MVPKRNTVLFTVFGIVVFGIMLTLNCLAPRYTDDWTYVFIFGTDHDRIQSLWDVVRSQYAHCFIMNGRITAQSLAQIVDSFLGKGIFNILNTLMFMIFLYAVGINTTGDRRQYSKIIPVTFMLVFLLMAGFYRGFLWMCGSFNYLWAATMLLGFHYILENKHYQQRWAWALLFLYGIVCGMTNEAFVVGLGGAYFIYYATHRKSLTAQKGLMLAGLYIGAAIMVFAPASINRAVGHGQVRSLTALFQAMLDMSNLRLFYLALIGIPLLALFRQLNLKQWLIREQVLIMATVLSFIFVWLTLHASDHSRIGIELFAMLLLLRAIPWEKVNGLLVAGTALASVVVAAFAIRASYQSYLFNKDELAQIERREYPIKTHKAQYPKYLERFVVPYAFSGIGERYKAFGEVWEMSKYFGNDSIFLLPEDFVQAATDHPDRFMTFQTDRQWPFYAVRETRENHAAEYALIKLKPTDYASLGWPLRLVAPHLYDYSTPQVAVKIQRCVINGNAYILATRIPSLEFRLHQVTLVTK